MNAASAGDGGGSAANSDMVSPGWVVWSVKASPCALDDSARNASPGSLRTRSGGSSSSGSPDGSSVSAWRRSSSIWVASRCSAGSAGRKHVAHLLLRRRRAADEAADDLAEEQLGPRARRVDADPQPRDVDALGHHQDRDEPGPGPVREAGDPRGGVRRVARHDLGPLAGDPLEPGGERLRVLLVGGDHEAAGVRMVAGADALQSQHGVAQDVGDPVAVGVERGAQAAGGLRGAEADAEVGGAAAAVGHPLHVAVDEVEGDRAADAVEQRVGVAVREVGLGEPVRVVGDPRDRAVVGPERRAGEQQPEARARERLDGAPPPRRLLPHVVRLVGDQQRGRLRAAAPVDAGPGGHGLVGHGDAVAVARLRSRAVRPVRLEVEAVAGGVGGPLARDVRRRRDDGDARDAALGEHPVRDVEAERRLAGRGRGRGEERVAGVGEQVGRGRLLPGAQRSVGRPGRRGQAGGSFRER